MNGDGASLGRDGREGAGLLARTPVAPAASCAARKAAGGRPQAGLKLLHTIPDLAIGGAEIMLYRLLAEHDRGAIAPTVLTLLDRGPVGEHIERLGVDVASLGLRGRMPSPRALARLRRIAASVRPDVIQGWMYHGNLAATLAWCLGGRRSRLVWSIHHSAADLGVEKLGTRLAVRANARLSGLPAAIVYCSTQSAREHEALGFAAAKTVVIPNGFDCTKLQPDPEARARLRRTFGIPAGRVVVGMITRAHPMKDHDNLIRAVAGLRRRGRDVQLIMLGRGVDDPDGHIREAVAAVGITDRTILLDERDDLHPVRAALDVLVSSSAWGEAFPLIVGDAMASGVPCVVTDVGDCARLVGDTGLVVPPRDSAALATALEELIGLGAAGRQALGRRARARIEAYFSLPVIARRYATLYQELAAAGPSDTAVRAAWLSRCCQLLLAVEYSRTALSGVLS